MAKKLFIFLREETGIWLLLGLVCILFADILVAPASYLLSQANLDMDIQFLAWRSFGFGELAKGNLALWNPHIYGGTPFFAGAQSALLYPPNWLHLIFSLPTAINLNIILHVYLMGLFTYFWGRGQNLSILAATFMAAILMFSGPFFLRIHSGHLPHLNVMPWFLLILLALDKMRSHLSFKWLLLGVFALAMQILAGHPQYTFYGAIIAVLYGPLSAHKTSYRTYFAGFCAIYILGAACAGVQLLSIFSATDESIRAQALTYNFASAFSLPPENLLTLFLPFGLGNETQIPYQGRWYYWEACIYGGLIASLVLVTSDKHIFIKTYRLYILLGLIIVLALGAYTPLHGWLYDQVPGFDRFRSPAKFSIFFVTFFALLAGKAFEQLKEAKELIGPAITIALFTIPLFVLANFVDSAKGFTFIESILLQMQASGETFHQGVVAPPLEKVGAFLAGHIYWQGLLGIALLLALILPVGRLRPTLILGLAVIELLSFALPVRSSRAFDYSYPPPWQETLAAEDRDVRVFHDNSIAANQGMTFGAQDLWGYDPLVLKRYAEFMHYALARNPPEKANQYLPALSFPPILGMLRAAYVFQNNKQEPVKPLPNPLKRAQLIHQYRVEKAPQQILEDLVSPEFNASTTMILEEEPSIQPGPPDEENRIILEKGDTDFFELQATIKSPALLLITDNFSSGWQAQDLNTNVSHKILRANYTLSALALDVGQHHIKIEYRPMAFQLGTYLSILSCLGLLLAGIFINKKRGAKE
ncbi:MAG: hypothetical protein CMH60_03625 [Myxococcales bacterium]|nr:hypothetical protein [Myxococcales bacterium]